MGGRVAGEEGGKGEVMNISLSEAFTAEIERSREANKLQQLAKEIMLATVEFQTLTEDDLVVMGTFWNYSDNRDKWKVNFLVKGIRLYQVLFNGEKPIISYLGVKEPDEPIAAHTLHGHYIPGSGDLIFVTEPREKAP